MKKEKLSIEAMDERIRELGQKDMKADFFDLMINLAEKEYKIENSYPEQSAIIKK